MVIRPTRGAALAAALACAAPAAAAAQRARDPGPPAVATVGGGGTALSVVGPTALAAEPRLAAALPAAARAGIAGHFAAATRAGIPVEPLVAKALEGVELGAPPDRIEAAVRALLGRLTAARAALDPVVSDAELVSGADALAAGVPATALRRVRALSPGRSAAVALGVLAQLVARGVPPARAADAVADLLRRGARPAQLIALDSSVRADVAAGVPAASAIDARARTLAGGLLPPPTSAPGRGGTGLTNSGGGNNVLGSGTQTPHRP